jgi:hypothetical protein
MYIYKKKRNKECYVYLRTQYGVSRIDQEYIFYPNVRRNQPIRNLNCHFPLLAVHLNKEGKKERRVNRKGSRREKYMLYKQTYKILKSKLSFSSECRN